MHEECDTEYGYDDNSLSDKAAEDEEDWESDEEDCEEPETDWDKMQEWFLANIAYPFLDSEDADPIIHTAPISLDHLELWVSEICKLCNWHEVYSQYADNNRSRMQMLCDFTFGMRPAQSLAGTLAVPKTIQNALRSMRESAIAACHYLKQCRVDIGIEVEIMANMLNQLPAGVSINGDEDPEEWSEADCDAWEAAVVEQYEQLAFSLRCSFRTQVDQDIKYKSGPDVYNLESQPAPHERKPELVEPIIKVEDFPEDEKSQLHLGCSALYPVHTSPGAAAGTKRKLDEYLALQVTPNPQCVLYKEILSLY